MSDVQHNVEVRKGTVTIATPAANGTAIQTVYGEAKWVHLITPAMEDTDSTNLIITDGDGGTVFSSGTKAESGTYSMGSVFPLSGAMTVTAVGEGTQSVDCAILYRVVYEA